jgi:hypothetical protein
MADIMAYAAVKTALELSKQLKILSELMSRDEIKQLVEYYERYRGCSEAYTYVTNKVGTKYYYWYLKCPGKTPSSIYLGKSPERHRARMAVAKAVAEAYYMLEKLRALADELENTAKSLEQIGKAS